jgi:hypothetical protein
VTLPACANCGTEIPYAATLCVYCGEPVGFPNVRAADDPEEMDALRERLRDAQTSTEARRCRTELEAFGTAVLASSAVITCKLAVLNHLIMSTNALMATYYNMVAAGARLPEDNGIDIVRGTMDAKVNPHDVHREISYGALSLDGRGVAWYGDFSLTLNDDAVTKKATVFEENPYIFCDKHGVSVTKPLPPGYRATWARRSELAMAKLHPKLEAGMQPAAFPSVLMEQGASSSKSDFIEVHVYGPIHPRAVRKVIARPPRERVDALIWKKLKKRLEDQGTEVEEI